MATVFIHKVVSLDGFISKPENMDYIWIGAYGAGGRMSERIMGDGIERVVALACEAAG